MKFISIQPEEQEGVNFDNLVKQRKSFVKFYHPMCGHCQNMSEAWNALKNNSKLKKLDLSIIEVHAGAIPYIKSNVARKAENQGVPFILMVNKDGEAGELFNSERSVEEMTQFILNNMRKTKKNKRTGGSKKTRRNKKSKKRRTIKNH